MKNQKYLANSQKQKLEDHLIGVAIRATEIAELIGLVEEKKKKIIGSVFVSGLLHDIGKVDSGFQNYISKNSKYDEDLSDAEASRRAGDFSGPFHNEISWLIAKTRLSIINPEIDESDVAYSVYWHHPAAVNKDGSIIRDRIGSFDSNGVSQVFDHFWKQALVPRLEGLKDHPVILEYARLIPCWNDQKEFDSDIGTPKYAPERIDDIRKFAGKKLILSLLIEADREISSLSHENLEKYLKREFAFSSQNEVMVPQAKEPKEERSREQHELAKDLAEVPFSVCSVDPGGGKTSVALLWWMNQKNKLPLMIALPRQIQVTGLYKTIEKDLSRLSPEAITSVQGVFNGEIQHSNYRGEGLPPMLSSDINILVFDRFLSPGYQRKQFSEFMRMLRSHLVIDEFHEFSGLYRMIPMLLEILEIRSWISDGGKTLLLSGTSDPSLLAVLGRGKNVKGKVKICHRESLSPIKRSITVQFSRSRLQNMDAKGMDFSDALISLSKIKDAQEFFVERQKSNIDLVLVHSLMTANDKKRKIEGLLTAHRTGNYGISVVTSKMLQSSYDLNFNVGYIETSLPNTDCQTLGRINRFGDKSESARVFFYEPSDSSVYDANKLGFKDLHNLWVLHVTRLAGDTESKMDFRHFMKCFYDDFWSEEVTNSVSEYIKSNVSRVLKDEISGWFPIRKNAGTGRSKASGKIGFRGVSFYVSSVIVDDQDGSPIGQLLAENLLTTSKSWEREEYKRLFAQIHLGEYARLNEIGFDYSKYQKLIGVFDFAPFLSSVINDELNKRITSALEDPDSLKVYSESLGLVPVSLHKKMRSRV